MIDYHIKAGDTAPALTAELTDAFGVPVNLTGISGIEVIIRVVGSPTATVLPAVVVGTPTDGKVQHIWTTGETNVPGIYSVVWRVTFSDGSIQSFPSDGEEFFEIEAAPDAAGTALPPVPDLCWPVDTSCDENFGDYSPNVQARAIALATQTLRALTAYRVGGCPITVRPCRRSCVSASPDWYYAEGTFLPLNVSGRWINMVCGCAPASCSCTVLEEVDLPMPVGRIDEVKVDGVVLPATAYALHDNRHLVRIDGGAWPTCQDMSKPDTEVGTFSVTYLNGWPVDGLGAYAAGRLASEYASACTNGRCALPSGVTEVARSGVTMTIAPGSFPGGMTGIREVDAYIMRYNPNGLKQAPAVWSPDLRGARVIR